MSARPQEIIVVGQLLAILPSLSQRFNRLAVALVQQVRMAQRQIRRRRRIAGVIAGVASHAGIRRRGAHRRQLLRHRPQLAGGLKGQLDARRPRPPRRTRRRADRSFSPFAGFRSRLGCLVACRIRRLRRCRLRRSGWCGLLRWCGALRLRRSRWGCRFRGSLPRQWHPGKNVEQNRQTIPGQPQMGRRGR